MSLCSFWTASAFVKFVMLEKEWIAALLIMTSVKKIIDSLLCICGRGETTKHYMFDCIRFNNLRQEMMQSIFQICEPTLNALLYLVIDLSNETNKQLFIIIQEYIIRPNYSSQLSFCNNSELLFDIEKNELINIYNLFQR